AADVSLRPIPRGGDRGGDYVSGAAAADHGRHALPSGLYARSGVDRDGDCDTWPLLPTLVDLIEKIFIIDHTQAHERLVANAELIKGANSAEVQVQVEAFHGEWISGVRTRRRPFCYTDHRVTALEVNHVSR